MAVFTELGIPLGTPTDFFINSKAKSILSLALFSPHGIRRVMSPGVSKRCFHKFRHRIANIYSRITEKSVIYYGFGRQINGISIKSTVNW